MTITEANDVNTLVHYAMGHRTPWPGGPEITGADATAAAKRLTAKAYKALSAGLTPDQVDLVRLSAGQPADGMNKVERLARDLIGIPDGL